jgi:hypothetical protein
MPNVGSEDNGVLARTPGELIAAAGAQMPPPDQATAKAGVTSIEVPDLGRVTVMCVLRRDPRWKRRYWSAVRADQERPPTI